MCRAKDGDQHAFGMLYDLYLTPIYRYLFFRVKHAQEAEDLTQTVFLKVFQNVATYRDQGKDPLAYFYTVARHTLIDHWRKKKEYVLHDPEDIVRRVEARGEAEMEFQEEDTAALAALQQALATLSPDQQDALILRFMNDMPTKDIARQLGKSEQAIRQAQSRGLRALRALLTEKPHDAT